MSETVKVIQTAKTADRIESLHYMARMLIVNKIGLRVDELKENDFKKLGELMEKSKKPVEFVMSFDGAWFSFFTRVGTVKNGISSVNIAEEKDMAKRAKILEALVSYGAATQAQVDALNKAHPDAAALSELKTKIDELKKKVTEELKQLEELKKKYAAMGGK
jgi:hypothetical protein